jgi:hypothetical protein
MIPNHPGELNGGGVLPFSESSPDRIGVTATARQSILLNFLKQPARVFDLEVDLEMKVDIQAIKGVSGGESRRSRA